MPCDSRNYWLDKVMVIKILPYLHGGLIAINKWHIAVHQNKVIFASEKIVALFANAVLSPQKDILNVLFYVFYSTIAIKAAITDGIDIDANFELKDDFQRLNVEGLVVNDQDFRGR